MIAVVGKYPVLLSDLETGMLEKKKEEGRADQCKSLEDVVFQKMLLAQADRDSVVVSDAEVEGELTRRMAYYIQMVGSEEKFEAFYGMRTNVFKDQMRDDVHDQLVAQKMQGKITGDIKLTPSEVRQFLGTIPEDSLPIINSEMEIAQIVRKPPITEEAKKEAREIIETYRQRVVSGERIDMIAALYSEDPGSARNGGYYQFGRGMMVPEFEAVAFRLKPDEVSEVFETPFGYHFMKMIGRKGETVEMRHVLVAAKIKPADVLKEKLFLDSLQKAILEDKISFEDAAKKFSTDKETKQAGGLMVNQATGSTKWDDEDIAKIDQNLVSAFDKMSVGDVTIPIQFHDVDSKEAYRIMTIKSRTDPHKANIKDDYNRLLQMATFDRQRKLVTEWIAKRSKSTYIKIDPAYACKFEHNWHLTTN